MANLPEPWIDPRQHPDPPCRAATRPLADGAEAIAILIRHCEQGRIYDIERWIKEGHPLEEDIPAQQWRKRMATPLEIAMKTGQWSLIQLLLVNGYRLDQEPACPLTNAIQHDAWDVLDLLCAWGADVRRMEVEIVIGTYRGDLIERLWRAGLDLGAGTGLAYALAGGTNRPLYGFIKRQRTTNPRFQFALDVALGHSVEKKKERAVALCLWAGANAHVSVPEIQGMDDEEPYARSTILRAARNTSAAIMKMLKPDPAVDDFNELFGWADDPATIDVLAARGLPADWSAVIWQQVQFASWGFRAWHECDCLERLFALGARVTTCSLATSLTWEFGGRQRSTRKFDRLVKCYGIHRSTLKKAISTFKTFLRWIRRSRFAIDEWIFEYKAPKHIPEERIAWNNEQARRLLAECDKPNLALSLPSGDGTGRGSKEIMDRMVATRDCLVRRSISPTLRLMLRYAPRPMEVTRLLVGNWDSVTRTLYLPGKITKNGRPRDFVVDREIALMLDEVAGDRPPKEPLFLTYKGRPYTSHHLTDLINDLIQRARIPGTAYSSCRHTATTRLIHLARGDLPLVQSISGHRTLSELQRYLHATTDRRNVIAETYDVAAQPPPAPVRHLRLVE